jgi:hypothetical protein
LTFIWNPRWLFSLCHLWLVTLDWVNELYYDRPSVGQSVLVSSPHLGLMTRFLLLSDSCGFVDMGRPLWREGGSVVYNCCCLLQHSHSQVRELRGSWPHFTVSDLRLPQPWGPGPCIYVPQEQGGPVIPPGTAFHSWLSLSLSYITTDGQSASLSWYQAPIWGLWPDFYYCQTSAGFRYGAPSLTRGRVCLYNVHCTIYNTFYCFRVETPPTWRTRSLYLYPPGTGWPSYTPRHWVSTLLTDSSHSWLLTLRFLSKPSAYRRESTSLQGSLNISPIPSYRLPSKLFGLPREQSISWPLPQKRLQRFVSAETRLAKPLTKDSRIFCFQYSGFQAARHSMFSFLCLVLLRLCNFFRVDIIKSFRLLNVKSDMY